ncbi:tetratricopeptide repeat protein 24 [Falco rusticolus]|uniref:tetratricopeptide repeat protein 24 n=1 Tax=Falco rusticolus TaxID=120794 RepID=UPI0018865340|nr:tetratricopeptide repeat protein 24 [Falco rusticolus]
MGTAPERTHGDLHPPGPPRAQGGCWGPLRRLGQGTSMVHTCHPGCHVTSDGAETGASRAVVARWLLWGTRFVPVPPTAVTQPGGCDPLRGAFQAAQLRAHETPGLCRLSCLLHPLLTGGSPTLPMASEAPTGAQPPAAPAIPQKSRKKGKEQRDGGGGGRVPGVEVTGRGAEVAALMRAGQRALARGDTRGAVGRFRKALRLSGGSGSPRLRRACAFNLGVAYVESGKPTKGLEFLLRSQPSEGESRERGGGLYFNRGAAQEGLQDFPKALERPGATQVGGRAGTHVQMGCCYLGMREPARAARCFLEAARSYAAAASPEAAAVALSRAGGSMLQSRRFGAAEVARVLAQCRSLCPSIPDAALRAKLYNDVGLGYCRLRIFSLAAESFQQALAPRAGEQDECSEAALLQNLGAAHNALGSFGTALGWHRRAAALHGARGNRRAQGQCFSNLAYACSRLGNHEAATENYLHALQAFRDSGDMQGQWQACEGLGAACLHLGDPQKAIRHYKEALTLLARCQDTPRAACERVVQKLSDAIQHQLCLSRRGAWAPTPAAVSIPLGGQGDTRMWTPSCPPPPQQDPVQLWFCSTWPRARARQLQQSKASFKGGAQAGDEPYAPGTRPRHSGRGAALADGPAPEPRNPQDIPGEDEDGPSTAAGCHRQPRANSNLSSTHQPPAPPRHGSPQPREYQAPPGLGLPRGPLLSPGGPQGTGPPGPSD